MKKLILFSIISLMAFSAKSQNLYIGSYYVTTTDEEALCGDGGDKWSNRLPVIYEMFRFEEPDVLGLQSLTSSQLTTLSNRMTAYSAAGDILYSKTLDLDTCGVVTEADGMPEGSTASWARLQKEGKSFYVFNVHFSQTISVAYTSVNCLRQAIDDINTEGLPCFITGNLGSDETKSPYTRLTQKYDDCYTKAPVRSAEYGTVNNFDLANNHDSARFDFVFASRNVTVKAYGQLQYGYFTKETDGSYKRRLPSTHYPVMAKVTLD